MAKAQNRSSSETTNDSEIHWDASQGGALSRLRRIRGLRQAELAEVIGQPRTVVSNFENATRAPRLELLERLAEVLEVPVSALLSPEAGGAAAIGGTSGWEGLVVTLQPFVAEAERYRIERFLTQADVYARLTSGASCTMRAWSEVRQLAADSRAAISDAETTDAEAEKVGRSLALRVRNAAGIGRSPMPPIAALADLVGVSIFIVPLSPGQEGRLRAALVERAGVGACVLVNAVLDGSHRLHAISQLIGKALLQPAPATAWMATRTRVTEKDGQVSATGVSCLRQGAGAAVCRCRGPFGWGAPRVSGCSKAWQ